MSINDIGGGNGHAREANMSKYDQCVSNIEWLILLVYWYSVEIYSIAKKKVKKGEN